MSIEMEGIDIHADENSIGLGFDFNRDQLTLSYEEADTLIVILTCMRNARELQIEVDGLYLYECNNIKHLVTKLQDTYVVLYVFPLIAMVNIYDDKAYIVSSILKDIQVQEFPTGAIKEDK